MKAPRHDGLSLRTNSGLTPLFEACELLEGFVLSQFPHGQELAGLDPRFLAWATTMTSLKSLDALLLLADAGYGPQAMMMSRTMSEDAVIGWWCSGQESEKLMQLILAHEKSVALLIQR